MEVARRIAEAKAVWVMTGAGVSAESGVPTFRGKDGFWGEHRFEDLATPQAFQRDPETVWRFYLWRRRLMLDRKPNPAHYAIAEVERLKPRFNLITQNVDGLHRRAGSRNVAELHGALFTDRCTECGLESRFDERGLDAEGDEPRKLPDCESIPHCSRCSAMMRPGVVWFGEPLPMAALSATERAVESADCCLVVGTSGVVYPAAGYVHQSTARGAYAVEINVEETALSAVVDTVLTGKAGEILPAIAAALKELV
ncbi:MAG: NAD-dependent deacylase [Phycisphaerales bacterium]|nr:MAG: NAD-dependent deacylase [Phycisphaerales bacterium]